MHLPVELRGIRSIDNMARRMYVLSAVGIMHVVCILCLSLAAMEGALGEVSVGPLELWSSTKFPDEELGPDNWRYYRVELPPMFSLFSISLTRNWSNDNNGSSAASIVPLVCFGFSGPPLPVPPRDSLLEAVRTSGATQNASTSGECGWFFSTVAVNVTNLEVLSGTLHVGIFSNAEPSRTQSKMIDRGQRKYAFALVIQVFWCGTEALGGPECNMGITSLPRAFSQAPQALYRDNGPLSSPKYSSLYIMRESIDESDNGRGSVRPSVNDSATISTQGALRPQPDSPKRSDPEGLQVRNQGSNSTYTSLTGWSDWVPSTQQCIKLDEKQFFSLQIVDFVQEMEVRYNCISNVSLEVSKCEEFESMVKETQIPLLHLRYAALPGRNTSDFLGNPSTGSVVVPEPKRGWWYLAVFNPLVSRSDRITPKDVLHKDDEVCLSLSMRAKICGPGLTGSACQWPTLQLERILKGDIQSPFDSYYYPEDNKNSLQHESEWFSLASFPNISASNATAEQWVFAILKLAGGTAGSVLSIDLEKSLDVHVELYARHEACPTGTNWDVQATANSSERLSLDNRGRDLDVDKAGSGTLKVSKYEIISLPIIYPMEGYWCIGLKYALQQKDTRSAASTNSTNLNSHIESDRGGAALLNDWMMRWKHYFACLDGKFSFLQTKHSGKKRTAECGGRSVDNLVAEHTYRSSEEKIKVRVTLQGCANDCSGHGQCRTAYEASRLHFISYCTCDVTHGDFDCSMALLTRLNNIKQRSALIFSNSAAILPSIWALRYHVYSEWMTYTLSGTASAIYHSCDAGGWCAMSYSTLQFLDFWLSFMAIIMTCLMMAGFSGATKSVMHMGCAVLTAAIAKEDATSAWNILVVVVISTICLLVGWGVETRRISSFPLWCLPAPTPSRINTACLQSCQRLFWSIYSQFKDRFHWDYLWFGLLVLLLALFSNSREEPQTYWFWHSSWHVCIYTCTFLLLISIKNVDGLSTRRDAPISYQTVSVSQRQDDSDSGAESPRSRVLELNTLPGDHVR